jgi:hypothetical protein
MGTFTWAARIFFKYWVVSKFFFTSIHKPPASTIFARIKHVLAVTVEPFKFSPAEPVAYELS